MEGINVEELKEYLSHYNDLKSDNRLFVKVYNADRSIDMLREAPHMLISGDLAMTFHVLIKDEKINDDFRRQSVMVGNALFKQWEKEYGITLEGLHKDALESAQISQPVTVQEIGGVLAKMTGISPTDLDNAKTSGLHVVTNKNGMNGAAALFYPDSFEKISEKLDGGFFCMPSSKHEFIVVSDSLMKEHDFNIISDLTEMIKEINSTEVSPDDYLSDTLYHYDSEAKIFEPAVDYQKRIEDKSKEKKEDAR